MTALLLEQMTHYLTRLERRASQMDDTTGYCPDCHEALNTSYGGHSTGCKLADLLKQAGIKVRYKGERW